MSFPSAWREWILYRLRSGCWDTADWHNSTVYPRSFFGLKVLEWKIFGWEGDIDSKQKRRKQQHMNVRIFPGATRKKQNTIHKTCFGLSATYSKNKIESNLSILKQYDCSCYLFIYFYFAVNSQSQREVQPSAGNDLQAALVIFFVLTM